MFRNFLSILLVSIIFSSSAYPCSSFQLKAPETSYVGKSYDWKFGDGFVIFNPKDLQKFSLTMTASQKKLAWTSKYSSITYNQYGLDFPNGGMNEEGLTVEVLWLDDSAYPKADDKAVLNELQWIQYILDTQSTLDGAIRSLDTIRIDPIYAKVHYFVCDLNKNCAAIEFVNEKTTFGTYDSLGLEAITNSTHQDSTKYLENFLNFGGTQDVIWEGYSSLDRFVRVNEKLRVYNHQGILDPVSYAFSTLDTVKRIQVDTKSHTQWQIVHNKNSLTTHFKTTFGNQNLGSVDLKSFPKECGMRKYFDLEDDSRGDLNSEFKPLNLETNYALVKKTLKKIMPEAPEEMIKAISGAPFRFSCVSNH